MSPEEKIMVETLAPIKPLPPAWTDERIELGKKLFADGLSASQIAAELGGITRNAVIGKAYRMGWERPEIKVIVQQPSASRRQRKGRSTIAFIGQSPRNTPQPEPYLSTLSTDDIPRQQRRTMATLGERHCRWPCGEPGTPDFFFCGGVRKDAHIPIERGGVPYCAMHCDVAFVGAPRHRTPYVYRGPRVSP